MQLKQTTDYAIRLVLCLASEEAGYTMTGDELAKQIGVSPNYLKKVLNILRKGEIIRSYQGGRGGFALGLPPDKINLYQIIAICEKTMNINRCLEDDHYCSRNATEHCPVRHFYEELQQNLDGMLKGKTIAAILEDAKK